MGLISKILGSGVSADKIVDKGFQLFDDVTFTKQEKAGNKIKLLDFWLKWQEQTKGQNLARRMIALILVGLYVLLVLMAVTVYKFDIGWSTMIFDTLTDTLKQPFNIIIGFYFANALIKEYKSGKK